MGREFAVTTWSALRGEADLLVTEVAGCRRRGSAIGPRLAAAQERNVDFGPRRARYGHGGLPAPRRAPIRDTGRCQCKSHARGHRPSPMVTRLLRILVLKAGAVADWRRSSTWSPSMLQAGLRSNISSVSNANPLVDFEDHRHDGALQPNQAGWIVLGRLVAINPYTGEQLALPYSPVSSRAVSGSSSVTPAGGWVRARREHGCHRSCPSPQRWSRSPASAILLPSSVRISIPEPQAELVHLPPSGVRSESPRPWWFTGAPTPDGTLLIFGQGNVQSERAGLLRVSQSPQPRCGAVPFNSCFNISPDGQWLSTPSRPDGSLRFFISRSEPWRSSPFRAFVADSNVAPAWRPGRSQVWFSTVFGSRRPCGYVTPGESPVSVPGSTSQGGGRLGDWQQSVFTADGAHWFFTKSPARRDHAGDTGRRRRQSDGARLRCQPGGDVNRWGVAARRRPVVDLRLYGCPGAERCVVTNLDTGNRVQLAERGRIAAVGQTRSSACFISTPSTR